MTRVLSAVLLNRLLPLALLVVIGAVDAVLLTAPVGIVAIGLLDESAHISTSLLMLLVFAGPGWLLKNQGFALGAVAGSVLVDLDHIPLYAGVPDVSVGGRPFSHSLSTALVLALVWLLSRRRWPVVIGSACGVLLHFVRDVANGPGVPLFWPVSVFVARLPVASYWMLMTLVAAAGAVRIMRVRDR